MGKIVLFMHTSLDGFAAGVNGEMDWIHVDDEIFDFGAERITRTNTALYGRVTFEMMEGYWPTAAEQPGASKHDKEHSAWYKTARKVVLSNSLDQAAHANTTVIGKEDYPAAIKKIKEETEGEILLFGSPSTAHALLAENLIDECWLFVNPVLLGEGIPVFKNIKEKQLLKLVKAHVFSSGVVCLQHQVMRTG
ncbi:dihydrofolate reductase [Filimonas zeae]|uniref:Riboflavin biosynthesis protein RibD n=1 Tax=Filimonas zeae TaxID=1737353 RepID=A0A917J1Y6_9BACT|nr:dihydrofolate reductase family protein [Filimonas zeae]MDR6341226.1 dihydrofolate reductase [Filimonas zeae]GGH76723.1 riboflavin biosynthesis protein RibD [Filimonas zeae]